MFNAAVVAFFSALPPEVLGDDGLPNKYAQIINNINIARLIFTTSYVHICI